MPYRIDQRGKKWCVVKDDAASTLMGCHDTDTQAKAQLSALYAREPEAEVDALFADTFGAAADPHQIRW